jgi:hypothetical protein
MRAALVLVLVGVIVVARATPAGADVAIGAHTAGGLAAATGYLSAGIVAGADMAAGDEETKLAIVAEQLWRLPDAYTDAREQTLTVEYRGYKRESFVGIGAGIRRLSITDAGNGDHVTLRGVDLRIEGGISLRHRDTSDIRLRLALVYGVYTNGIDDDGGRVFVGGLDYFTAQMLVGIDIASRL